MYWVAHYLDGTELCGKDLSSDVIDKNKLVGISIVGHKGIVYKESMIPGNDFVYRRRTMIQVGKEIKVGHIISAMPYNKVVVVFEDGRIFCHPGFDSKISWLSPPNDLIIKQLV